MKYNSSYFTIFFLNLTIFSSIFTSDNQNATPSKPTLSAHHLTLNATATSLQSFSFPKLSLPKPPQTYHQRNSSELPTSELQTKKDSLNSQESQSIKRPYNEQEVYPGPNKPVKYLTPRGFTQSERESSNASDSSGSNQETSTPTTPTLKNSKTIWLSKNNVVKGATGAASVVSLAILAKQMTRPSKPQTRMFNGAETSAASLNIKAIRIGLSTALGLAFSAYSIYKIKQWLRFDYEQDKEKLNATNK